MPEVERRHTAGLTALGVLSVVFGALFVLASLWGLLQPQVIRAQAAQANAPQMLEGLGLRAAYLDGAVNLVLSVLLFIAGIGLLQLRNWGSKLAVGYAVARIAWSVIAAGLAIAGPFWHRPALEGFSAPLVEFMKTRFAPLAAAEILSSLVLSSIFAVILLALLSRKSYQDNLS